MAIGESEVDRFAAQGREGDSLMGHLTPGDLVLPMEIQTPEIVAALRKHFAQNGAPLEQYLAGHKSNSVNPKTGAPEFFSLGGFLSNPLKTVENWVSDPVKAIEHTVEAALPIAGAYFGGPIGAEIGGTASGMMKGESFGNAAKGALPGAALAAVPGIASYAAPETMAAIDSAIPDLGINSTLQSAGNSISNSLNSLVGGETSAAPGIVDSASGAVTSGASGGSTALNSLQGGVMPSVTSDFSTGLQGGNDLTSLTGDNSFNNFTQANSALPWQQAGYVNPTSADAGFQTGAPLTAGGATPVSAVPQGVTNGAPVYGSEQAAANAPLNATAGGVPAGGAAGGGAAQSTGAAFLKNPGLGTFGSMLEANPAAVVGAGGLAYSAIKGDQPVKGESQLMNAAGNLTSQSNQLSSYLQNGTLPPGVQGSINQAAEAQKAAIRSRYAQMGGTGSSGMEQELAAVDAWAQGQGASTAMSLLSQGINEAGLASSLYENISNTALQQDQQLGSAIGNFASSLAGGSTSGGKSIKEGPNGQLMFG